MALKYFCTALLTIGLGFTEQQTVLESARAAFLSERYAEAERLLRQEKSLTLESRLLLAHAFYHQNKWEDAAAAYAAIEPDRRLTRDQRRILTDNLGIAYAMAGDLARSRKTFEAAISRDPSYAMYHYNLACVFAERGELTPALRALKQAYSLRANTLKGEEVPDARYDDSFRRYAGNAEFLRTMREAGFR